MKTISIVTHAYNEEDNIEAMYLRIREIMQAYPYYAYEHIFIDNHSTDSTAAIIKRIAAADQHVKLIVNARNFGHIRSPVHAFLQARGDAVIGIASDFQEPPDLIPAMIAAWEEGYKMVLCVKKASGENGLVYWLRKQYYKTVERLSSVETIQNFTGFGMYDRQVVDIIRGMNDPYPYFRGIIAEISLPNKRLYFHQPARKRGITKNNFYTLYDIAMLGFVSTSKVPLRLATFAGFVGAVLSFLIAFFYLVAKIVFWKTFSVGVAPMIIGVFFLQSLMLVFFGIVGEYIGAIYTKVQQRPYVTEQERIGFEFPPAPPSGLPVSQAASDQAVSSPS
ncbi:MAG TPA: glycosyltransferase family 2 protein [Acidobacteriaceae bacterium]|nr:glycosyltransferase family 2 protein [Acidobacteriaceae bacterium]